MARIAIMALEGLEEDEAVGTDIPVEEMPEQAEPAISEVNDIEGTISDGQDGIEEADATIDTLDEMADGLEATLPEGGVAPEAAEVISTAVEHMCSRIGIRKENTRFALEGFKSKTTRVQATRIAMEGIREWAAKIWKAIVDFFNKAVKWVKDFINKTFDAANKLKKRAIALKKAAEDAKSTKNGKKAAVKDKDGKVEAGWFDMSWGHWLSHDKKYLTSTSEILTAQKKLIDETVMMDAADKALDEAGKLIDAARTNLGISNLYTNGKTIADVVAAAIGSGTAARNTTDIEVDDNCELKYKPLSLGTGRVYAQIPKIEGSAAKNDDDSSDFDLWVESFSKTKLWVSKDSDEPTGTLVDKVMSIQEIITAASNTIDGMGKYNGYFAKLNAINKKQEVVANKASKEITVRDKDNTSAKTDYQVSDEKTAETRTGNQDHFMKTVKAVCKISLQISTHGLSGERSYQINAHKAVLDYASKSLSYWN